MSRSTRSTISPARPRPIHYQIRSGTDDQDVASSARSTCSGLAKRLKARIFQASTSEVYGDPTSTRSPRATAAMSTRSVRAPATTKASAARRRLFFDYFRQHNLRISVARIFNTYGPRMHPNDGRVVSNFIVQALKGSADHDLRRRHPDPLLLLCRRSDRRLPVS